MAADTLTTIATNSSYPAFGLCFQSNIHFSGEAWKFLYYSGNGTTSPVHKVAYGDPDSGVFGAGHDVPNASQIGNRGYKIHSAWNPALYKYVYLWSAQSRYGKGVIKNDADFISSSATDLIGGLAGHTISAGQTDGLWGCSIFDKDNRIWLCDTYSSQTQIRVKRSTASVNNEDWPVYTSIVTGLGGTVGATLVPFHNRDIGCIYANGSSIYYKNWTQSTGTWESAETVVSAGSFSYQQWTAVSTVDGDVVVFWKDLTTPTTIKCRIRSAAGSWGSTFDAATDLVSGGTVCATNNLGSNNQVFFYYSDGTDLVMNSVTSGALGSKFTMVASLPALMTVNLQSPRQSINKFGVIYQENATGAIKLATHSSAPIERGSSGKLVSSLSFLGAGTFAFTKQVVEYGELTFITWNGYDGKSYANVYNNTTSAWLYSATAVSSLGYWDTHNGAGCVISSDGYVYLILAGRLAITTAHLIVKKSDYPIGHGSFSLTAFTDISPDTTGITSGRGYKYACVDSNGILHVATIHTNVLKLRNYNGSTWTTYAAGSIADFDTVGTLNYLYVEGMLLGKEPSGQQTLNIAFNYWDATHGTGTNAYKHFFMRVTMQGDRSYLAADIGGTSITLPIDETYTSGNALYFDGSVETTKLRTHWNGFDLLEDNSPHMVSFVTNTSSVFQEIRSTQWNGSAWVNTTVTTEWTDRTYGYTINFSMIAFHDALTDLMRVVYASADGSGIPQLLERTSSDSGASWSAASARTTDAYTNMQPSVDANILYTSNVRISSSEVRILPRTPLRIPRESFMAFF